MSDLAATPASFRGIVDGRALIPAALLLGATLLAVTALRVSGTSQSLWHDPTAPGVRPIFVVSVVVASALAQRRHHATNLAVAVAAAIGIRVLFAAHLCLPIPIIDWARGTEMIPPEPLLPLFFSGSVYGVGQMVLLLVWASVLPMLSARSRRRGPALVTLAAGAFATACALTPQPMLLNTLMAPEIGTFSFPAWTPAGVVDRTWTRLSQPRAPAIAHTLSFWHSDQALAALGEGMAERTHGPSGLRRGLWVTAGGLTAVTLALRVVSAAAVVLSLPFAIVAAFRRAPAASWLRVPTLVLFMTLAGGNVLLTVLAVALPEGRASVWTVLPYHLAFAGFVAAALLGSGRLLHADAPAVAA